MRIATVVQGRIFGFDLARGLLANSVDTLLLTNYPKWAVERFDVPARVVRSFPAHGVITRLSERVLGSRADLLEPALHRWFGAWAARVIREETVDTVQIFSGVAEEAFVELRHARPAVQRIVIRASTHIKTQRRILAAEQKRLGTPVEQPSAWRIAREVREYQLADKIMLLSGFTHRSFVERGYSPTKLIYLPMGADVGTFQAPPSAVDERARRISAGAPLQVLIVGTFSARKGAKDMVDTAKALAPMGIKFRFVGAVAPDAAHLEQAARQVIEFAGFQPQAELPKWYAQGDVFFFPTLEDGFALVLAQALSSGLPLLSTPNSAAADLIKEGVNGWIRQPRDTQGFIDQLRWCDQERQSFAAMVSRCGTTPYRRDWPQVARELLIELRASKVCDEPDDGLQSNAPGLLSPQRRPAIAQRPLNIAFAVHGRFHAFDLCRALQRRDDVRVTLLTNYSHALVKLYGIDTDHVRSLPFHRLAHAVFYRISSLQHSPWVENLLYRWFGSWAARQMEQFTELPDVIRVFSSVAEETLRSKKLASAVRIVTRGSTHIRTQRRLLLEEEARTGVPMFKPSDFLLEREEREYALADCVQVVSSFAATTFQMKQFPRDRLWMLPNAVNLDWYGASVASREERRRRLLSAEPLRVLMVGTFSYRKGVQDWAEVVRRMSGKCVFRFVGDITPETLPLVETLRDHMQFRGRVPPQQLGREYAWGDVFLLPTIEDGFPATLTQALAGGLVSITTPNGSGPDLIRDGENGWITPIRDPSAIARHLEWLDTHREEAVRMCETAMQHVSQRSWDQVADEFVAGLHARWPQVCGARVAGTKFAR